MQVPDTFMICSACRYFGKHHHLPRISLYRILKTTCLPVLHQRRVNTDVGDTNAAVARDGFKKESNWFAGFHPVGLKREHLFCGAGYYSLVVPHPLSF